MKIRSTRNKAHKSRSIAHDVAQRYASNSAQLEIEDNRLEHRARNRLQRTIDNKNQTALVSQLREKIPIQRKINVVGGIFDEQGYNTFNDVNSLEGVAPTVVGASMGKLSFKPKQNLDAEEVHLVQIVKEVNKGGELVADEKQGNLGHAERIVKEGKHKGWAIDAEHHGPISAGLVKIIEARLDTEGEEPQDREIIRRWKSNKRINKDLLTSLDPRYSQQRTKEDTPAYAPANPPKSQHMGYAALRSGKPAVANKFVLGKGMQRIPLKGQDNRELLSWQPGEAALRDQPSVPVNSSVTGMDFEVTALAKGGALDGQYLGSVSWGFRRNKLEVTLEPVKKVSEGTASESFFAAAGVWNELEIDGKKVMQLPIPDKDTK